jgi:hypothetical protein
MALWSYKITQFLKATIKLLILALAFYFVGVHWQKAQTQAHYDPIILSKVLLSYSNIAILLLLTIINWGLEGLKWRLAVSSQANISFGESLKQILSAHISGLITPAKVGDFGTKALYYPKEKRKKVFWLSLLSSWYQMLATLLTAVIGVGYMIYLYFPTYLLAYLLVVVLSLLCWRHAPRLIEGNQRIKNSTIYLKYKPRFGVRPQLGRTLLGWSLLRYIVFAHQFYFLMLVFDVGLSYWLSLALISSIYLLSSVLPMLQFFDVFLKSSLAVIVFGYFDIDQRSGLLIPLIMWLFNVVLPILPGTYFLLRLKPQFKSDIKWL